MNSSSGFEWRNNPEHHDAQARMGHMTAYYGWVLDLFGESFEAPAADAGAGSGHFAELLSERVSPLLLLEGGEENLAVLRDRFASRQDISVVDCDLTQCRAILESNRIRSIFTLDVLEHLPDDLAVLRQFHDALPSGGMLYIKVPALQWLYGPVDEASGHFRRYTARGLRGTVESAGFEVRTCRYMNLAAVGPYFLKSRILKRSENFSRTFSIKQIRRIQRMMPIIRTLDRITGAPLGLSVFCVARKG